MNIKIFKNSKKYGSYVIIIDYEDFQTYQLGRWTYSGPWDKKYCKHRNNKVNNVNGYRSLHRLILKALPNEVVDHINGNPLDNRRINLRITNDSGNAKNRNKTYKNKSGYKGVHQHKNGSWVAQIQVDGTKVYLGSFKTKLEAIIIYNDAVLFFHEEYANFNEV